MTYKEFDGWIMEQGGKCLGTLVLKGEDYAGQDRLDHFKKAAALTDATPEEALWGMAAKHVVSVAKLCRTGRKPQTPEEFAVWDEKIGDTINYMLILSAMIREGKDAEL